jgi:hypothetical protein
VSDQFSRPHGGKTRHLEFPSKNIAENCGGAVVIVPDGRDNDALRGRACVPSTSSLSKHSRHSRYAQPHLTFKPQLERHNRPYQRNLDQKLPNVTSDSNLVRRVLFKTLLADWQEMEKLSNLDRRSWGQPNVLRPSVVRHFSVLGSTELKL